MAFVPLANGIRVAVEYNLAGEVVVNVYHVVSDGPVATVNLTAVAQIFLDWWDTMSTTGAKTNFSSDIALVRVVATDISVAGGAQIINQPASPIPGSQAGDAAPNNVAWVMGYRTGHVGRSYMGRTYHTGFQEANFTNNVFSGAIAADMLERAQELQSELAGDDYTWVVASYENAGAPRVEAVGTPISLFQADTIADSQRRRLPGR